MENDSHDNDDIVLLPDYEDDPSTFVVSFHDIKRKTTQTLYPNTGVVGATNTQPNETKARHSYFMDKSPKGSVDRPIQELVDLINHHPSFSTLSSCSGRIALFRPWETNGSTDNSTNTDGNNGNSGQTLPEDERALNNTNDNNNNVIHRVKGTPGSGKGSGGWLLVSHEIIDDSQLLDLFDDDTEHSIDKEVTPTTNDNDDDEEETVMMFKVEPMLLHVAAATLDRGRQLLALALDMGFRESGLVLPTTRRNANNRVTVAIRGVSLSLVVPLTFRGPLRPSRAYLKALVHQANRRLKANESKLQRLTTIIKETLFRRPTTPLGIGGDELEYTCQNIPDLNLWGHGAVVLPGGGNGDDTDDNDIDVVVFGGYGQGPFLAKDEERSTKQQCRRMGEVHCLYRRNGQWGSHWERISQSPLESPGDPVVQLESIEVNTRPAIFTPRERVECFALWNTRIAIIWGGRKSPRHPLNELLLYEHQSQPSHHQQQQRARFVTPIDVRGETPAPRWGHSLTPLECSTTKKESNGNKTRRLAVLVGGRNERESLNSVHILSLVDSETPDGSGHFLWEQVTFPSIMGNPIFPFDHATLVAPSDDKVAVFIFGGLSDPCNLLEGFSTNDEDVDAERGHAVTSFMLSVDTPCIAEKCLLRMPPDVECDSSVGKAIVRLNVSSKNDSKSHGRFICLSSGGVPSSAHEEQHSIQPMFQAFEVSRQSSEEKEQETEWRLQSQSLSPTTIDGNCDMDESVMVYHRALDVSARDIKDKREVLLIGGGVMGFAFGPCFSK